MRFVSSAETIAPLTHSTHTPTLLTLLLQATSGPGYWISDMDVACFKGWHRSLTLGLALPVLLLFSLGVPIAFAVVVGKRNELQSASCKEQLGYAYRSYR